MPRTIKQAHKLQQAIIRSTEILENGIITLKGFADAQALKFEDLETDRIGWSFDDRLIFAFNLTTTSIFSTDNQEYVNQVIQDLGEYIMRGIEAYALWHHLSYDWIYVKSIHWASYYEMIVTYADY